VSRKPVVVFHLLFGALAMSSPWHAARAQSTISCTWGGTSGIQTPATVSLRSLSGVAAAPARIASDAQGRLYMTDPHAGGLVVLDRFGRTVLKPSGFTRPLAVAVDTLGFVYVSDEADGSVTVLGQDGGRRGHLGAGPGEFQLAADIAIDPDPSQGTIYVADAKANLVKAYSPSGGFLFGFGGSGSTPGLFDFPVALTLSGGELFVADQNNDRVQVFSRDGALLRCFGARGPSSFSRRFGRIQGLTADTSGRIYVADAFQGRIQVFDRLGVALGTIGSFGDGPGQFSTPYGMAIDPHNRLIGASHSDGRLLYFGLDTYSDPQALPAAVAFDPPRIKRRPGVQPLTVILEIPGASPQAVDPASLTIAGVALAPWKVETGDRNRNGVPDLAIRVDAGALLLTLGDGPQVVEVNGALFDGTAFTGSAKLDVRVKGDDDDD